MTRVGEQEIQVLGLCRWSYPSAPGAFKGAEPTVAETRAKLYDPARLAVRLFYLEHILLPGLRKQTDRNFTLLMLMGDQLPPDVRAKVEALIADVPQVVPVYRPEGENHREICREVMLAHRDLDAKVIAEFRIDDDDAVACEFTALARELFRQVRPLFKDKARIAIDMARGYMMRTNAEGIELAPVLARLWTPGLISYVRPHRQNSILDFPHLDIWKRMEVVSWRKEPMFVRGVHSDNDSNLSERGLAGAVIDPVKQDAEAVLRARFGIDLPKARKAWSVMNSLG